MTTVILVRHGRTSANASGVLAGRSPGVQLDEAGIQQAELLARRLQQVPLTSLVTSPLERTVQTARIINAVRDPRLKLQRDRGINEFDYGDWSGQPLKQLAKTKLWQVVQHAPSQVHFPVGEAMAQGSARAIQSVRAHVEQHEPSDIIALVSHGDIIKALLADALGMHLDLFQRIVVDPGSISIVEYTSTRPLVISVNDTGSDPLRLGVRKQAVVGGGAGQPARRK